MRKFIYKHPVTLSVVWALIIFGLCATPGQYIPSADWLELLSIDKWVHAGIFLVLTSLLFVVAIKFRQNNWIIALYCLICIVYGVSLEIMQATCFSNRSADWKDIIANTFGCLVALLLFKQLKTI